MNSRDFMERVAFSTLNLLIQGRAMHYTSGIVFYVWMRGDRIILAFDPSAIRLDRVNDGFAHALSTRLQGRRVVRTNSRGLFLQVALDIPKLPALLDEAVPLDLTQQPTPWHLPVGMTPDGPLWISMVSGISFLIGGSTGAGKTGEEHAWIQALLHGGKTQIYAWDGKGTVEFIRYADQPNFHLLKTVSQFEALRTLFREREEKLKQSGSVNIGDHNDRNPLDFIPPIALFVDEAADLPDVVKNLLKEMIRINRYLGLYPIIATNQPTQAEMFAKVNLQTRIAFRVPHHNDSITVLGYKGAEALPDVLGRGMIKWKGKLVEFQSFRVVIPPVSEAVRQMMAESVAAETPEPAEQLSQPDEIVQMAESIRDRWSPSLSKNKVSQLFGKNYAGNSWCQKIDQVIEYLSSTTTTTKTRPFSLDLDAIAG